MSRDKKSSGRRSGTSISECFLHILGMQLSNPRGLLGAMIGRVIFAKGMMLAHLLFAVSFLRQ